MKTSLLCFLLFALLLGACNKSKISLKQNTDMVGQYEWVYSFGEDNGSESTETISDQYGIVLKENGKARLYKNSELVSKGFVMEINAGSDGEQELMLILNDKNVFLTYTGSTLEYKSYPISSHTNVFQKL